MPSTLATIETESVVLPFGMKLVDVTKRYMVATLDKNAGDRQKTAQQLGISFKSLERTLLECGIRKENSKPH
jgi:DNA-binding NtrC family response regulator